MFWVCLDFSSSSIFFCSMCMYIINRIVLVPHGGELDVKRPWVIYYPREIKFIHSLQKVLCTKMLKIMLYLPELILNHHCTLGVVLIMETVWMDVAEWHFCCKVRQSNWWVSVLSVPTYHWLRSIDIVFLTHSQRNCERGHWWFWFLFCGKD